jgi:hypothetical protein
MELKWSTGEPYERSKRIKKGDPILEEHEKEQFAYAASLNHDENTWEIVNQSSFNGFQINNKREELDNKISDRSLVQQRGFNPFLHDTSSYVEDIAVSDKFLKPVNTTQDREGTIKP